MMNDFNDEVKEALAQNLQDYQGSTYDDLFNDTCNTDQYCDRARAEKALANFYDEETGKGIFGAIRFVKNWLQDNGLEINIDKLTDAENLIDDIYFIKGERILNNALDEAGIDDGMDAEITDENIKAVKDALNED